MPSSTTTGHVDKNSWRCYILLCSFSPVNLLEAGRLSASPASVRLDGIEHDPVGGTWTSSPGCRPRGTSLLTFASGGRRGILHNSLMKNSTSVPSSLGDTHLRPPEQPVGCVEGVLAETPDAQATGHMRNGQICHRAEAPRRTRTEANPRHQL